MKDFTAWILPATLLMTIAFGALLLVESECVQKPRDLANPIVHAVAGHLFFLSMVMSGLLALKCVNDFTTKYLSYSNTPAKFIPQLDEYRKIRNHGGTAADNAACRSNSFVLSLGRCLSVPSNQDAMYASVRCLSVGFVCGIYLKYGWTYAVAPALAFLFFAADFSESRNYWFGETWVDFSRQKVRTY